MSSQQTVGTRSAVSQNSTNRLLDLPVSLGVVLPAQRLAQEGASSSQQTMGTGNALAPLPQPPVGLEEAFLGKGLARTGLEIGFEPTGLILSFYRDVGFQPNGAMFSCGYDMPHFVRANSSPQIVARAYVCVCIRELKKVNVPQRWPPLSSLPSLKLRETPCVAIDWGGLPPEADCGGLPPEARRAKPGASQTWLCERRVADRAGFEPAIPLPVYTLSKRAPSAARPPVRQTRFPPNCPARLVRLVT
jgi:hypothetical protein